jgi:hypothetical protein
MMSMQSARSWEVIAAVNARLAVSVGMAALSLSGEGAGAGDFGVGFRGVEGEDVGEGGGLVEEGLQLDVRFED